MQPTKDDETKQPDLHNQAVEFNEKIKQSGLNITDISESMFEFSHAVDSADYLYVDDKTPNYKKHNKTCATNRSKRKKKKKSKY